MAGEAAIAVSHFAAKGPAQVLPVSKEGERRFFVGLSWGARDVKDTSIEIPHLRDENGHYDLFYFFKLPFHLFRIVILSLIKHLAPSLYQHGVVDYEARKKGITDPGRYDLDLSCYVFGKNLELCCVIGPEEDVYTDASKKVYHSGDDIHGSGGSGDDEQAFVETRGLPDHYQHFFFVIETDGRYSLDETPHAHVRLADSRTNKDILRVELKSGAITGQSPHGYVFCHVFRGNGDEWLYRDISDYHGFNADWVQVLQGLIKRG